MQRILNSLKKGILYACALVLVAGYPASVMADTQEPATEPLQVEVAPEASVQEIQVTSGTPETPVIIEPDTSAQPHTDDTQQLSGSAPSDTVDKTVDTNVTLNTDVTSNATSGDSTVTKNTSAGDATTGNAHVDATIINAVNSTINTGTNQKVATFTEDIMGDVKGDIILYPLLLKAMLEAQTNNAATTTVNATTNFGITNNIDLTAKSGNASVTENTSAGNATTGSAEAVANVVNILNSMIATQNSFVGTINIYGNLEGDILIAPDFIPQLLANNGETDEGNVKVSKQDTTTIVNNISAVAESGAANVFGNTLAGDATTGDADSNVVIFNISGHDIVAKNSLLVFVNVLGQWVGVIVDAPANATAAMVGNEVTKNETYAPDLTVNSQSNLGITNTIAVTAQSGDATVAKNTSAGNATSGQARALANIANVSGSQFGMSDWFGVLFINVFQSWHGSFGIDTAYGNTPRDNVPSPTGPIQFIPTPQSSSSAPEAPRQSRSARSYTVPFAAANEEGRAVLAATTTQTPDTQEIVKEAPIQAQSEQTPSDFRLLIIAGSLLVIGLSAIGIRYFLGQ